jgi:uncharacterized RDD family membrane protein YckC
MDREQHREAQARLERDYLAGELSADDYARLRTQLQDAVSGAEAAAPAAEVRYAGWGRRAAATLLDGLVVVVVFAAAGIWAIGTADPVTDEPSTPASIALVLAFFVFPILYPWLMVGARGQTLGKMALGERVVRGQDFGRVGYARAFGRIACAWVLGFLVLPLLLAYLWPLWDERNQTLYDKMVDTVVVRVR